jgi:putative adhesin
MPTFPTPDPVTVAVTLKAGNIRVVASERADTVVEIDPPDDDTARVELVNERLTITVTEPKRRGPWMADLIDKLRGPGSRTVSIELPTGSNLEVDTPYGEVRSVGTLGTCRLRLAYGDVQLDRTGPLDVHSRHGDIVVDHVDGNAEISVSSGDVTVRTVTGSATITNNHSDIDIGQVGGTLRLTGTHGEIAVARAASDVSARNAYGGVRIAEAVSGVVDLSTTYGELEIGIATGTAAWLDVSSSTGSVRNELTCRSGPDGFDNSVEVRARTRDGDVVIRRA